MDILTAAAFEDHIKGPFWKELKASIEAWIPDLQVILEDPEHTVTDKEADRARGSFEAIRNLLMEPSLMLETKKAREAQGDEDGEG